LITSAQIRAARALLNWSRAELAHESGIGLSALMRLESSEGIPGGHIKTLDAVQKTFEEAGVEFIGTPDDRPGVRLNVSNKT
jgi:transcriptional regulator with XRE-family HTH domain